MGDRPVRGVLDTSVVVDLERIAAETLPHELAISTVTLVELAAGPMATANLDERARRQDRLQRVEAVFDPLPFDVNAARAYGRVFTAVRAVGRRPRGRFADLLIAATAVAHGLPLVTRNAADLVGLERLVDIIEV